MTQLQRQIGFFGGIGILVGVAIGSGIFRTPAKIATGFDAPSIILLLWLLGGLLCLAGALTFAELAAMHPNSGGLYVFIREAFGPMPAFVFGWSYMLLAKPFAAAGIAFVFAEHLNLLLGTHFDLRVVTTLMLLSLTVINLRGVGLATGVGIVLTAAKVAALLGIVLLTIVLGKVDVAQLQAPPDMLPSAMSTAAALTMGIAGILWTYDGWADVGSIAGEVKRPQTLLPRIYLGGTALIIALYLGVNAAYFFLVPLPELRALAQADPNLSIAPLVMERLIGPAGAIVVTVIVLLSTLGSSHASIMTGARVSYAQAADGLLFRFIAHVHPKYKTPDVALIMQVLLSCVAVWLLGSFQALAESFVFTMWLFYGLGGVAIFVLRRRRPDAVRPFRCPGYPVVPAIFVLSAVGIAGLAIAEDPGQTLPWLGVLAAGAPVYLVWQRMTRR